MIYLPVFFLVIISLIIITRPVTVLLHELGHAIPAMLFTKKSTMIYIGSYEDERQSFHFRIGLLTIWINYNPLKWAGGLCKWEFEGVAKYKKVIVILGGTIFSFITSGIIFYVVINYDLHGSLKLFFCFVFVFSTIDLITNLIPRTINTRSGNVYLTDGKLLYVILFAHKYGKKIELALQLYNDKEYNNAIKIFEKCIADNMVTENVYRYAAFSYIAVKDFQHAYMVQKELESRYVINSNDCYNLGYVCLELKRKEEAQEYFEKSLELNPDNHYTLNGLGYNLNTEGKYEEAIILLNKALTIDDKNAYAYNNRGHAKIETGKYEEGLADINHSISLDATNSYAYRNLGIYHLFKNKKQDALQFFLKAKEMDKDTDLIEDYILKAKSAD